MFILGFFISKGKIFYWEFVGGVKMIDLEFKIEEVQFSCDDNFFELAL